MVFFVDRLGAMPHAIERVEREGPPGADYKVLCMRPILAETEEQDVRVPERELVFLNDRFHAHWRRSAVSSPPHPLPLRPERVLSRRVQVLAHVERPHHRGAREGGDCARAVPRQAERARHLPLLCHGCERAGAEPI